MAYQAGDLELSITGVSGKAVASISKTIDALNSLSAIVEKVNSINNSLDGSKLTQIFLTIANSARAIDKDTANTLGKIALALNSISRLSKIENLDFEKVSKGFNTLTTAITPFLAKVKESEASLVALDGVLKRIGKNKLGDLLEPPKDKGKGIKELLNVGKFMAVFHAARRIGRAVGNIVQSGADYTETLNLWRVSMNDFEQTATSFVNKMNEAYGISEKTLMQAQATFKNMLGSLGTISDQMAYSLSEAVTKMAIDYSSLYNVGIEDAVNKFQSALAGQVRPVRAVSGYDITENTLYQLYQSIGGTKTVRQLNQTEKRLLAIYAIFNQMEASGAINDMDRTINSFANQSRVMAETFNDVKQYAGMLTTNLLENLGVMTSINAVLSFTAEFLKALGTYMGALQKQPLDIFGTTTEGAEDASKAIDEVKGKLLGFDQFRSLSGQEEEDVDIDEALAKAIGNYGSVVDDSLMGSKEIAREWLKSVGLIYDANSKTYELTDNFKGLADRLSTAGDDLVVILGYLGVKGILGVVGKLVGAFGGLGNTMKGAFSLKNIGISALIGALYYMYTTNEEFRESANNLFSVLGEALPSIIAPLTTILTGIVELLPTILDALSPILTFVVDITTEIIKFLDQTELIEPLIWGIIAAFAAFKVAGGISSVIGLFGTLLLKIQGVDGAVKGLKTSTQIALTAGIAILAAGIASLVNSWGDMTGWHKALTIIGAVTAAIIGVVVAIKAFSMSIPVALGLGAALAGGVLLLSSQFKSKSNEIDAYADGGLPDKGSMFLAGEAGAEIVYNNSNGQSGVANIQQIAQATYQGTMGALRDWWGGMSAKNDIPQLEEANATGMYQAVTSVAKSYGNAWSKV